MKRILTMALVCMMLFCGTAFAAEVPLQVHINGKPVSVKHPMYKQYGWTLMAAEDLAAVIGGEVKKSQDGKYLLLQGTDWEKESNPVWLNQRGEVLVSQDGTTDGMRNALPGIKSADGTLYLPLNLLREELFYEVRWNEAGVDLQGPILPKLSVRAEYKKKENKVTATLMNEEQQEFHFGMQYFLQKKSGTGWERVPLQNEMAVNDIELTLRGDWRTKDRPGMAMQDYSLEPYGSQLEKGVYRICIPVSTEFYPESQITLPYPKEGEEEKLYEFWHIYFMTEAGKPFYSLFPRSFLTERSVVQMEYVVSGSFTAE